MLFRTNVPFKASEQRSYHLKSGDRLCPAAAAEIAAAAAFLASHDASFITASSFLVDGGISGAYVAPL